MSEACTTAILLAAGVGRRLGQDGPKILARVGDQTLLTRHLRNLTAEGISEIVITVGYQGEAIDRAVEEAGFSRQVRLVENARYREGSLLSLWCHRQTLRAGRPVLVMDGDVLYDRRLLARLIKAPGEAVLLVDRVLEPGDEPVKVCFRGDTIVDFRKMPEQPHDWHGESVGFFKFSAAMAASLADCCEARVQNGESLTEYEEAIRDLILKDPAAFHACDIGDLPWTEIDFPEDLARAREEILPRIHA
ncbi:MAG: phosphocholine cytidylyltransferase family protein [Alphaproteobacteria bacterium]|nr:phosphocholine cytidylyltransferase family protein [Alphaproteobacteria bacterium]